MPCCDRAQPKWISVKACQRAIELSSARRCCCSARPGSATPTSAVAIGRAAILAGYAVLFIQATTLAAALARAHGEGRLEDKLTQFAKPRLLIVDELGYLPFEPDAAHLFFQLVSRRYERGSKLITSNRAIGEWGRCLGDPVVRRRSGPPPAPQPGRHYPWRQLSAAREAPLGPAQGGGRPARAGADRLGPGSPRWAYRSLPPAYGARLMARGRRALPWTTWTSLPRYGHQHRKGVSSSCRQGVTSRCRLTPVRNAFLEIEFVEQPILSTNRWPHHRHSRPDDLGPRNHAATILSTEFVISLGQERPEYTGRESKRGACGRQPLADRGPIGPEASSLAQSHTQSRRLEAVAGRRAHRPGATAIPEERGIPGSAGRSLGRENVAQGRSGAQPHATRQGLAGAMQDCL